MQALYDNLLNLLENLPTVAVATVSAGIVILLSIAYLISRRAFSVWHEALFLQRTNRRLRDYQGDLEPDYPFYGKTPKRIQRAWDVFREDVEGSTFLNINDYIKIQNITGKGEAFGRGGLYLSAALVCALLGAFLIYLSCAMQRTQMSEYFPAALPLVSLIIPFMFVSIGRNAYKLLDEQCSVFCSLASLHIFCSSTISANEIYSALKETNESIKTIGNVINELPDVQQAIFSTKEMVAAIAHVQSNANAEALEKLAEQYCDTMNERMNGQLARMGEIMQATFDSQNAIRNAMLVLLNDIQTTAHTLRQETKELNPHK